MSFSVVIPTMWRSNRIINMLDQLQECDYVDEVIIIDNDYKNKLEVELGPKVKYLKQEENIFVNPAWNLGVSESSSDIVCLLNDDITFDVNSLFSQVYRCFDRFKCIGVNVKSYGLKNKPFDIMITPGHHIKNGWGCCIFVDRTMWVDIPKELKIFYGDNWIAKHYQPWSFIFPMLTEFGTTSATKDMSIVEATDEDHAIWSKIEKLIAHEN